MRKMVADFKSAPAFGAGLLLAVVGIWILGITGVNCLIDGEWLGAGLCAAASLIPIRGLRLIHKEVDKDPE